MRKSSPTETAASKYCCLQNGMVLRLTWGYIEESIICVNGSIVSPDVLWLRTNYMCESHDCDVCHVLEWPAPVSAIIVMMITPPLAGDTISATTQTNNIQFRTVVMVVACNQIIYSQLKSFLSHLSATAITSHTKISSKKSWREKNQTAENTQPG